MKTLYIIDGHNILHRAYHAPMVSLRSSPGEPTKATYGFVRVLAALCRDRSPDYLAVAMDGPRGKLRRRDIYPEYKANRKGKSGELRVQIKRVRQILKALRVPIVECEGYEADDCIATLAREGSLQKMDVWVVSGDSDMEQVLRLPGVTIMDPHTREIKTAESMLHKRGYPPAWVPHIKALAGDSTDNIPGLAGVGEKGAREMLAANFAAVMKPLGHTPAAQLSRLPSKLVERNGGMKQAKKLYQKFLTITSLEYEVPGLRLPPPWGGLKMKRASAIFSELGFRRFGQDPPDKRKEGTHASLFPGR